MEVIVMIYGWYCNDDMEVIVIIHGSLCNDIWQLLQWYMAVIVMV